MSVQHVMAIHLRVVEVFQPAPKWWTDQLSMLALLAPKEIQSLLTAVKVL